MVEIVRMNKSVKGLLYRGGKCVGYYRSSLLPKLYPGRTLTIKVYFEAE